MTTWADRDDYDQSLADHHALPRKDEPMTLHNAVAGALAKRREDIVADLTNTERWILEREDDLVGKRKALDKLRADLRAIDDAANLLTTIANKEDT